MRDLSEIRRLHNIIFECKDAMERVIPLVNKEAADDLRYVIRMMDTQVAPTDGPYIEAVECYLVKKYNPLYGDDRVCECGHPYYRHFDPYEDNAAVGCKYCGCQDFKEAK